MKRQKKILRENSKKKDSKETINKDYYELFEYSKNDGGLLCLGKKSRFFCVIVPSSPPLMKELRPSNHFHVFMNLFYHTYVN